jgi:hypothetical protein
MPRTLQMKQAGKLVFTLRSEFSTSGLIYRVREEQKGALARFGEFFRKLGHAYYCRDEWAIESIMHKVQSSGLWLYEDGSYIPYRAIGIPSLKEGFIRFRDWTVAGIAKRIHDFPELEDSTSCPEEHPEDEPDQWIPIGEALREGLEALATEI